MLRTNPPASRVCGAHPERARGLSPRNHSTSGKAPGPAAGRRTNGRADCSRVSQGNWLPATLLARLAPPHMRYAPVVGVLLWLGLVTAPGCDCGTTAPRSAGVGATPAERQLARDGVTKRSVLRAWAVAVVKVDSVRELPTFDEDKRWVEYAFGIVEVLVPWRDVDDETLRSYKRMVHLPNHTRTVRRRLLANGRIYVVLFRYGKNPIVICAAQVSGPDDPLLEPIRAWLRAR